MNENTMQTTKEGVSPKANRRILWLDALKGYGILVVMLSHLTGDTPLLRYLFAGYMPLFWMASGYVDTKNLSWGVLRQKAKRLLIPYFVYGSVSLIVILSIGGGTLNTQQVTTSFEGLLYSRFCLFPFGAENNIEFLPMNATAPLWFLTSLFMGFCTYYLLFGRAEQKTTYDYVCAVGCVVMTIILSKLPILLPWSIDMAFLVALFIWLGKKARRTEKLSNISLTAIGFACLLLYVILVYKNGSVNLSVRIFGNLGWKSVGICTIVGATYFLLISVILRFSPQLVQRPLAFIGNHALRLMCVHMPVFFFVDTLLPSNEMDLPYIILSKFATAVCVSWMLGFMIARSGNTTIKRYL